ncbi:MAG: GNAT family protein, partial [Bacilli bacterium]|nr:GNAT family protein [Bacilli bacterium]
MYYKKYESKNLYLSPMCVEDYKTYTRWVNDESLASGLGNFSINMTEEKEKEWLEYTNKKNEYNFAVIRKNDDKLLGNYGLEMKNEVSRRYHIGGFICEKDERGKGYGTEALELITKFAFEIINAETLFSTIFSFNEASLKSAIKAGYNEAGRYRKAYFYKGEYHDEICIEITKGDYLKTKN